jgi:hypothetical protein
MYTVPSLQCDTYQYQIESPDERKIEQRNLDLLYGLDSVLSFFVCDGQRLENFSKHSTAHRGVLRCDTFTSNMGREGNGGKGREGMTKLG